MPLNQTYVRSQFPALDGEWVFLDNAGGSQILQPVLDRIQDFLVHSNVQRGASYAISQTATERVDEAARAIATLVNASHQSEVIIGPSTTMLLHSLAFCMSQTLGEGDEIIVTDCDHESNIGPWLTLSERGVQIKFWNIDTESLTLELDDLDTLMTDRTRLVAVTHTSNIMGSIYPIRDFARFIHSRGALICVDGVAFAPHRRVDVQALEVDFYALSFYKLFGPHQAVLFGKRDELLRIPGMNHYFVNEDDVPYKFQPGNVNYELSYGLIGILDYLEGFSAAHDLTDEGMDRSKQLDSVFDCISQHEELLADRLLQFLKSKEQVNIMGDSISDRSRRVPTISFVVDGMQSSEIPPKVDGHHIGIRFGHFYSKRLIDALGLGDRDGVVRISMVHYNTIEEIDRLIAVLDEIL